MLENRIGKSLQLGRLNGINTSTLITNASGLRMSQQMLRNRWDEAREKAAIRAGADGDPALAVLIRQFQVKDIRPKAASEIELTHASRLLSDHLEDVIEHCYKKLRDETNQSQMVASGWIAIPEALSLDEAHAARIFEAVGAWNQQKVAA
jgi:hypothetical protein